MFVKQRYFLSQYHSAISRLIIPVLLSCWLTATTFLNMQNNLGSILVIKISGPGLILLSKSLQSQQFKIDVQITYLMCIKKHFFKKLHHNIHLMGMMNVLTEPIQVGNLLIFADIVLLISSYVAFMVLLFYYLLLHCFIFPFLVL